MTKTAAKVATAEPFQVFTCAGKRKPEKQAFTLPGDKPLPTTLTHLGATLYFAYADLVSREVLYSTIPPTWTHGAEDK